MHRTLYVSSATSLRRAKQKKSTKILISWQELKNQVLSFLFIDSFQVYKKPNVDCSRRKPFIGEKKQNIGFRCRSPSQTALIFNLKLANINFPRVRKRSWMEKFGHFPRTEKFFPSTRSLFLDNREAGRTEIILKMRDKI